MIFLGFSGSGTQIKGRQNTISTNGFYVEILKAYSVILDLLVGHLEFLNYLFSRFAQRGPELIVLLLKMVQSSVLHDICPQLLSQVL